jgi:ribosomal protein S18 acetylase RimI-like enzyme
MALHIRPAVARDAAALATFAAETFHATYAAFNTVENMTAYVQGSFSAEHQTTEIADTSGFVLLAFDGAAIVGYAQILPGHGALEIKRFYIAPSLHGRGVAQLLMNAVVETAMARGAGALWLSVWDQNPRAIAFYRKTGFADAGTTTFTLGTDVQNDLLMRRRLQ